MRRLLVFFLAAATLNVSAQMSAGPTAPGASMLSPAELQAVGIEQRLGSTVPGDLTFTDSSGQPVRFGELVARKPTLLALVYFDCPNLCTLVLNGMLASVADLRRTVGDGFQVVVVSIDPTETSRLAAQKKAAYLLRYSRGKNQEDEWSFLVGDKANIQRLADAVGYHFRYDPVNRQFAHGSGLVLLDARGRVVQYFLGIEYAPVELEKSIQLAQEGQIGSTVRQFFLLCYCYNPLTGPYGFLIFTVIKIAAGLTVFALAAFIIVQVRRDIAGRSTA